jgi:hypothetical protein
MLFQGYSNAPLHVALQAHLSMDLDPQLRAMQDVQMGSTSFSLGVSMVSMMILWCFYVAMMIPGFLFFIVNSNGVLMGQESIN